jgi:tetratricopeptide (TPR) repeat protein
LLLALVIVPVLAYSNSFAAGFALDNKALILDDSRVHAATVENLALIVRRTYWWPVGESGLYRPLTTLSYLFNYAILGNRDRPAGYHAINLALHIVNVALVYAIVSRLTRDDPQSSRRTQRKSGAARPAVSVVERSAAFAVSAISFAIALVWAVHPLSTEAVTNIVGRADLLAAFGVLAALFAYIRAREANGSRRFWWLVALATATAIGVLSKESAVVIAAIVAVYELAVSSAAAGHDVRAQQRINHATAAPGRTRSKRRDARPVMSGFSRTGAAALAIAVPLLLCWYQHAAVLNASPAAEFPFVDNPIAGAGFPRGALTALAVMGRYLWLLLWPAKLSADYSYTQIPLATGTAGDWLAWITGALLAAAIVVCVRRRREAFFFGVFAFLTFLPASNLLFPTGTIMAERLMYLPSIGLIALIVFAIDALAARVQLPAAAPALIAAAVIALGVRTWLRNPDWRDNLTLWSATVETAPSSFKAHRGLAEAIYEADPAHAGLDRAVAEMEKSTAILASLPDARNDARTHRELASYYLEQGDAAGASALQHRTPLPPTSVNAYRKAIAMAQRTLAILDASPAGQPHATASADAQRLLSAAYVRVGDNGPAIDAALRARALEPSNIVGHRQLAAALLSADRYEDAGIALMTGILLTNSPELRQQLIDIYQQGLDPLRCAVAATKDGPALNPGCPTVRRHLCAATADAIPLQIGTGRGDDAERLKTSATELGCR